MSSKVSIRSSDPDQTAASNFSHKQAAANLSPPLPACRFTLFKAHIISDTRASLCPWGTVVQAMPASISSHCLPTIIDGSRQVKTLTADSGSCFWSIHCDASATRLTVVTKASVVLCDGQCLIAYIHIASTGGAITLVRIYILYEAECGRCRG